ncbi:helix-turn-helix transcriptional regulator [Streptomyces sp. NBC_01716]|uniref:helix-turn-helix transcriptional regulator n=1 Tax=Streptomyces sp. NBC_01716 TaxID=2975917 RepID=UPI002E33B335|nr:helix-turn-helix transcriptional regulator [Streptomyces sp. NBC_01716]
MGSGSLLGDYLRTRRERVRPEDARLPPGERRRVPGLRREEVALLAGVSTEYYLRLEQGRDRHPSDQVLESLARALRLDDTEARYLTQLARPATPARRRAPRAEKAGAGVSALIDQWSTPAQVQGLCLGTLAANPMAVALSPYFAPGANTLSALFLEPEMREFYRDWHATTAKAVAYLRSLIADAGRNDDPRLIELVGELSLRSERFRGLWARQDVRHSTSGVTLIRHPLVGDLDLHYEKFALASAPGQMLVTYHAEPGSDSYERLQLLGHLAARGDARRPRPGGPPTAPGTADARATGGSVPGR